MENVDEIPFVVTAACVLYNFCLLADDGGIDEFLEDNVIVNYLLIFQGHKLLSRETKWLSFSTTNVVVEVLLL